MNSQGSVNASLRTKQPEANSLNRYLPSERPRSVLQPQHPNKPNLASEVGFAPVTALKAQNGNVYVRAVKNTSQRSVSPGVVAQNGQVSIRGEHVIELGKNLHEQIRAKVNSQPVYQPQVLTPKRPSVAPLVARPAPTAAPPPSPAEAKQRSQDLRAQLEQINQELYRQIKQKIADELARQKGQPAPIPAQAAVSKPIVPKAIPKTPVKPALPKIEPTKPQQPVGFAASSQPQTASVAPKLAQAQTAPSNPRTVQPQVVQQPSKPPVPVQARVEAKLTPLPIPNAVPQKEDFQAHIGKLEAEIEALTKEISHLDQAFVTLEKESNENSLNALSAQLDYDQKIIAAVASWRGSLTDLVNSHTLALKYLKQKSDWLEDKVDSLEGHRVRHEKLHHKPKELDIKFIKATTPELPVKEPGLNKPVLPQIASAQPASTEAVSSPTQTWNTVAARAETVSSPVISTPVSASPTAVTQTQPGTQAPSAEIPPVALGKVEIAANEANKAVATPQANIVIEKPTLSVEPNLNKPATAVAANVAAVPVKIEKATLAAEPTSIEAAETSKLPSVPVAVIEKQIETEKPGTAAAPTQELIKKLVAEELAKSKLNLQAGPSESKSGSTEIAANVSVGQPKVLEGNPEAQINVTAIPVSSSEKPKENLPSVATAATLAGQSDIERQILETAAREEAAKDAVIKAKEEAEQKTKEAKEKAVVDAEVKKTEPAKTEAISNEGLATELTNAKVNLSKADPGLLKPTERTEMIQKLQNLENQSHVTRQFDEIKAAAERRKINSELQGMLSRLEHPQAQTTASKPSAAAPQTIQPQVEALKQAQKAQRSPEEKARIIAEIKGLEREREARKLEERSRPVIKAQPAYGKMLPNTPTIANVINGIVKDNRGLLLDTTVIIVKDNNGDPVRAFKTNKIGQFALSTPVPNGVYTLELEKQGYDFDIIEVEVNGGILPPIEIKAR